MGTTFPIESEDSPAAGIIPEPVSVHEQPSAAAERSARRTAERAASPPSGQGRARSTVFSRLLGALRGDKYMVDAYPPPAEQSAKQR
jgi:hypothetical protein